MALLLPCFLTGHSARISGGGRWEIYSVGGVVFEFSCKVCFEPEWEIVQADIKIRIITLKKVVLNMPLTDSNRISYTGHFP
jgi:hypothetical protein